MRRLIEEAFPLRKVSEDSKHEKSAGRKGHISTLHIWPARRPLAASRAAVMAALLPDPADAPVDIRREYEKLAESSDPVKQREDLCARIEKVTRWGGVDERELDILRDLISKTYGGEPPKVLDIFSGGGAIPLEAMRLGAHAIAVEYNPVAWFILKCTLEFPSKLARKTWPLPDGDEVDDNGQVRARRGERGDLAAHVRYWGEWVRSHVEDDLARYFPVIDDKPPIVYFWARTVPCQDPQCGATVPLLMTQWLCTKKGKERALRLHPNSQTRRVDFEVFTPKSKSEVGGGTVANGKAFCPFHDPPLPLTAKYIKKCGKRDRMGVHLTAVGVSVPAGKEYREPTPEEIEASERAAQDLPSFMPDLPGGALHEPLVEVRPAPNTRGVSSLARFGIVNYGQVFVPRQQLALGKIAKWSRHAHEAVLKQTNDAELAEAILGYLYCVLARSADRNSSICTWQTNAEKVGHTFARWALPMTWDFCEVPPSSTASGGFGDNVGYIAADVAHLCEAAHADGQTHRMSATADMGELGGVDAIITDPPYYGAIPYADLSDFFYVWLRRVVGDKYPAVFNAQEVVPRDEELVQHAAYGDGDHAVAKRRYEDGMARAFGSAAAALHADGSMVVVFANKEPDAWDALVTSIVNAGCTVTASWPIATERTAKVGAGKAAHLSTSVWLVCRRRAEGVGIGRYKAVQREMEARITERLRYFWDLGISGPDFVWAAVGPALESYSRYREVRRLDGSPFTVTEFLREVRRLVTDFALGRILHGASTEGLDETTRYYLMHRSSFGLDSAPAGECILLAQGYNLDLNDLRGDKGVLTKAKGSDLRLTGWDERQRDDLGLPDPSGGLPFIDALHRAMRLWTAGDAGKLREYLDQHGLQQSELFWTVAQAVLEMSEPKARERTLLEAIIAWGRGKQVRSAAGGQGSLFTEETS